MYIWMFECVMRGSFQCEWSMQPIILLLQCTQSHAQMFECSHALMFECLMRLSAVIDAADDPTASSNGVTQWHRSSLRALRLQKSHKLHKFSDCWPEISDKKIGLSRCVLRWRWGEQLLMVGWSQWGDWVNKFWYLIHIFHRHHL